MTGALWLAAFTFLAPLPIRWEEVEADSRQRSAMRAQAGEPIRELSPGELEVRAASEVELGKKFRHDAAKARLHFRAASLMYDELWARGFRDPALALNRAHSHRLAADLPGAIVALNEGLASARWSRPLQVALEEARSAVAYPTHSDLAAICRPAPSTSIGTRMSPFEAQLITGVLWLVACCSIARFAMTRNSWWLGSAAVWLVVLAILGGLWLHDSLTREDNDAGRLVAVAQNVQLRKGNAEVFPLRLDGSSRLPAGVEARLVARRGGWMQIRLYSGIIGWVPETAVLQVGD